MLRVHFLDLVEAETRNTAYLISDGQHEVVKVVLFKGDQRGLRQTDLTRFLILLTNQVLTQFTALRWIDELFIKLSIQVTVDLDRAAID